MEKLTKLEPIDEHILSILSESEEHCWGYDALQSNGYGRRELQKAIKKLRDLGYVEYWRGLMTEDGEVAGSGFCRSKLGNQYVDDYKL